MNFDPYIKSLPAFTNFVICALITISGLHWLLKFSEKYKNKNHYVFRSYVCWWLSWLVWTITWGVITYVGLGSIYERWIFVLSDLNTILLIILYFNLTRGNLYKPIRSVVQFSFLFLVFLAGYLIFLIVLPTRFDYLQQGWGIFLSAVSTILVGWAFFFRYKTKAVLIIGFIYAFAQPLVFDAVGQKEPEETFKTISEAIVFIMAILKVFWATIVTIYFTQAPATNENIYFDSSKAKLLPKLSGLPGLLYLQTILLLLTIIVLGGFIVNPQIFKQDGAFFYILKAMAVFTTFLGILATAYKWILNHIKDDLDKKDD